MGSTSATAQQLGKCAAYLSLTMTVFPVRSFKKGLGLTGTCAAATKHHQAARHTPAQRQSLGLSQQAQHNIYGSLNMLERRTLP